jgi:hypothetical protein
LTSTTPVDGEAVVHPSLLVNLAPLQFTILEALKPNVYVSDIVMNNNALVGDVVKISAVLKNKGTAPRLVMISTCSWLVPRL